MSLIIEICPIEPRASACLSNGQEISSNATIAAHMADCRASGDCQPACEFVLDHVGVEFRIVARNAAGNYQNRLATESEITDTCRAIYFDSDSDFTDQRRAAIYLVWEAANSETG